MGILQNLVNIFREKPADAPAKVVITNSAALPMYRFEAVQTFESSETKSTYVKGMKYTVRAGNDKLDGLVQLWESKNLVKRIKEA